MDFDSIPGGEQDDELFDDVERGEGEVEFYSNKEKANVIQRAGRIRDALNRCSTWTIYGGWGVVVSLLVSFLGGLTIAPYLPEEWVNTELIFKIFDWTLGAFKELLLVISAYFLAESTNSCLTLLMR